MTGNASGLTLHHVGIVVPDIAAGVQDFARSLCATWDGFIYQDLHQKAKVAFLEVSPGEAKIELVEPLGEGSPVQRFLQEKGGVHHLCYEVADLEKQIAEMRARGAMIAKRPKPAEAFQGRRIAWLLTAERLLVELLERSA